MNKKRVVIITLFVIMTIASLLIGVSSKVTFMNLITGDKEAWHVLAISRLPRTATIVLTAASLSIAGLIMQSLSRNKFISPGTAGTTDAAVLGVLIGFLCFPGLPLYAKFGFAFIFALLSTLVFIFLLSKIKFKNIIYVPLIGMMYGALISATATLIAQRTNNLQILSSLNLGTFSHIGSNNYHLILVVVPALLLAVIFATKFSIVSMGEDFASNLGINYKRVMFIGLMVIALISASTFIVVGPLPFLGLIIPNIVTMYYGDHFKKNLLDIALFGATFVLINDIISRVVVFPYEVSIGFTMGIIGAVIFLGLIFRRLKHDAN